MIGGEGSIWRRQLYGKTPHPLSKRKDHEAEASWSFSLVPAFAAYGTVFFVLSTLLPTTPPRMPPTAAPIRPPFTLLRLVVAPITAPAAAPIAASRWVCFTVTSW